MYSYIIINHTHEIFEIALFIDTVMVDCITEDKRLASKMLVVHCQTLLNKNALSLTELSFIGVNQGPGLFSTLRSIITTVNALHFACSIPLIGVDALDATMYEFYDKKYEISIVCLDAFNGEIYYAIAHSGNITEKGYQKTNLFLERITREYTTQQIQFIGNGALLYKELILAACKEAAIVDDALSCSLLTIALFALNTFTKKQMVDEYLVPLHLKKHPVELL